MRSDTGLAHLTLVLAAMGACGDGNRAQTMDGGAGAGGTPRRCLSIGPSTIAAGDCGMPPRLSVLPGETRRVPLRLQGGRDAGVPVALEVLGGAGAAPAGVTVTLEAGTSGADSTLVATATASAAPQVISLVVSAGRATGSGGAGLELHVLAPIEFGHGDEGQDLAIEPGGRTALVADCVAGARLVRVDLQSLRATATVALGAGDQRGYCATAVAVEPSGASALVAYGRRGFQGADGQLLRVDLGSGATTVVATGLTHARGLAIESAGSAVLSEDLPGQQAQRLVRVDLASGAISPIVPSLRAGALLMEPGGRTALALASDPSLPQARLARIDLATGGEQHVATLDGVDPGAPRMAFEAGGAAVVTPSLVRVELATGRVTRLAGDAFGGVFHRAGAIAAAPDGSYLRLFGARLERVLTGLPSELLVSIDGVFGPMALDGRTLAAFVAGRAAIARVDLGSRSLTTQAYAIAGEHYYQRLVLDPAGGPAFAVSVGMTASVDAVDLVSGAITTLAPGLSCGVDLAAEPAGTALVVEGCANRLLRLDPGSGFVTPVASELEAAPQDGSQRNVAAVTVEAGGRSAMLGLGALIRLDLASGAKEVLYAGPSGVRLQARDDRRLLLGDAQGIFQLDLQTGARTRLAIAEPLADFALEPRGTTVLVATVVEDATRGVPTGTRLVRVQLP